MVTRGKNVKRHLMPIPGGHTMLYSMVLMLGLRVRSDCNRQVTDCYSKQDDYATATHLMHSVAMPLAISRGYAPV